MLLALEFLGRSLQSYVVDELNLLRLLPFLSFFILFSILQYLFPRHQSDREDSRHLTQNFVHLALAHLIVFLIHAGFGYHVAEFSRQIGQGFLYKISLSNVYKFMISFVFLDLALYFQHRLFHKIPLLWRLHRLHHTDEKLNVSTALRFHFLEILVSLFWKGFVVIVVGIPLLPFLVFESFLSSCALFHHSNLGLPKKLESFLGLFLVTPGLHRVHHSLDLNFQNSNFGFSTPFWDCVFGSYKAPHEIDKVGDELRAESLWNQIRVPFKKLR